MAHIFLQEIHTLCIYNIQAIFQKESLEESPFLDHKHTHKLCIYIFSFVPPPYQIFVKLRV